MTTDGGPLRGVRVIDFTWAAMGPYAGYLMACLGAEVIHVSRPNARNSSSATASLYHELNVGKINIAIDLKFSVGRDLLVDLAAKADVFIENFRPGVVEKLGLGYQDLMRRNPRIIMVSGSALGRERVDGQYVGYAPIFSAGSGLADLTGYPDGPPVEIRHPVDLTGGAVITLAVLAALGQRRATNQGCYVDIGARDAILWTLTAPIVLSQLDTVTPSRIGNGHLHHSPHGVYRCSGANEWVAIVVADDDEWARMSDAIGRPELRSDDRFSTAVTRVAQRGVIDGIVEEWTSRRGAADAVAALQRAGIAASPSLTGAGVFSDPHLSARGAFQSEAADNRTTWFAGPPWMFNGSRREMSATLTGEAALQHALGTILGLSARAIDDLKLSNVIG